LPPAPLSSLNLAEQRAPVTLLVSLFWSILALLVLAAALRLRARLREPLGRPTQLDDAAIRAIENTGHVEMDDELDLAVIEEEERRFLEEEGWE
jgi:hypothetical protein